MTEFGCALETKGQRCGSKGQEGGEENSSIVRREEFGPTTLAPELQAAQMPGTRLLTAPASSSPDRHSGYGICTEWSILSKYISSPVKDTQGGSGGHSGLAALRGSLQEHLPSGPQPLAPVESTLGPKVRGGPGWASPSRNSHRLTSDLKAAALYMGQAQIRTAEEGGDTEAGAWGR